LYVALRLQEDPSSPWYQRLDLGGEKTVGMKRVASLRTMQMGVKRLVKFAKWGGRANPARMTEVAMDFWRAVSVILPKEWAEPRKHMLVKGIGVYALMSLAGTLVYEADASGHRADQDYFIAKLSDFLDQVDWSNEGALRGFGGSAGAEAALTMLIETRKNVLGRTVEHA
jgi:DNA sulfur modification protein DndB